MKINNLVWNVYCDNFNSRTIGIYNVFHSLRFSDGLTRLKREYKKAKTEAVKKINEKAEIKNFNIATKVQSWETKYYKNTFNKELDTLLKCCFWGKCEYEIGLTTWPAYITTEELDVLKTAKNVKYRTTINLEIYEKIDIYEQLKLNFNQFVKYVWENCIV